MADEEHSLDYLSLRAGEPSELNRHPSGTSHPPHYTHKIRLSNV